MEGSTRKLNRLEQEQLALEEDINKKTNMFQQNQKIIEDARSIVSLNEGRAKASLQEEQKIIMGEKTPPPTHENPVNPQPQFKATILVKNVGALDPDCAKFDSHIKNKHSNPLSPVQCYV